MNYFRKVEKTLKSCLKERVSITMATVVGFLIAGTVAFGAIDIEVTKPINQDFTTNEEEVINVTNKTDVKGDGWWNHKGVIDIKIKNDTLTINNSGKINPGKDGHNDSDYGINVNAVGGSVTITNEKEAEIQAKSYGVYVVGDANTKINIKNDGLIKTHNVGIYARGTNNLEVENNGKLNIGQTAGMFATGIHVGKNTNGIVKNNGEILVNAGQKYDGEVIPVSGIKVESGQSNKVDVINNGKITLGDDTKNGVGIYNNTKGSTINNGIISYKYKDTNNKAIIVKNGTGVNNGIVQLKDIEKDKKLSINESDIFDGNIENKGMIVDKNGVFLFGNPTETVNGDMGASAVEEAIKNNEGSLTVGMGGLTITNTEDKTLKLDSLKVTGETKISSKGKKLTIAGDSVTLDRNGKFSVEDGSKLEFINGVFVATKENEEAITLGKNSSLDLAGMTFTGNIIGSSTGTKEEEAGVNGTVNIFGNTVVDGKIQVDTINIGNDKQATKNSKKINDKLVLKATSTISGGKLNIKTDGQLVLEVTANGTKGETALGNSTGVTVTGTASADREDGSKISIVDDANGDILLSTGNLTGTEISVDLGSGNTFKNTSVSMENGKGGVYTATDGDSEHTIKLEYNKKLFKENGAINAINNGAMNANNLFENTVLAVREQQMKNIYEGSIYSETVRASYDSAKTFENVLRGMNTVSETGKWTAFGSGVYNKNSYDRAGHDSEIETTGLLAGVEYGLDANTSVGFAFAGANQDVDSLTGSADGTALYLGTYAKKVVGNYKFMAGLGYQYGDYDADNVTGYAQSSDSYNSNTLSAFVEGRYSMSLGNGIAFEPKLKLGYTYVDQDDTRDANFGVSDASLSTFDTELGADLIKTYALKDGKTNLVLGVSYVRAMGDTDKEFTGDFTKSNGGFAIKGAQLSENTGKFDLSLEVSKDSGFFYNGGLNLQVGSDDYRNYGVNFGAGYRF